MLGIAFATAFTLPATVSLAADNDNFNRARYLGYGDVDAAINTTGGTEEVGETLTHRADGDRNLCNIPGLAARQSWATHWWWFRGSGRPVTVSTSGSSFDTILGVYDEGVNSSTGPCADDISATDRGSRLTFPTSAGTLYHAQVGGCTRWDGAQFVICTNSVYMGQVHITATTAAVAHDARGAAATLTTGQRVASDNYGATEEAGEALTCAGRRGPVGYGRTVWYRWSAPESGTATFTSTGIDTVLSVYRADGGGPLGCDDDQDPTGSSRVALTVTPGDYLLQIGGYGANDRATTNDSAHGALTALVEYSANPDRDGDNVPNGVDCEPDNKTIPRREIPQNGRDEDCVGGDAPYPKLSSSTRGRATWSFYADHTRLTKLWAVKLPKGAKVEVRCTGTSCPARRLVRKSVRRKRAELNLLTRQVKRMRIRPTTAIQVRITKPRSVGRVKTWTFRDLRKDPKETDTCLAVGRSKPARCASLPG